jgi:hypothetical protein
MTSRRESPRSASRASQSSVAGEPGPQDGVILMVIKKLARAAEGRLRQLLDPSADRWRDT